MTIGLRNYLVGTCFWFVIMIFFMTLLGACSAQWASVKSPSGNPTISQGGQQPGTWNQTPHGGSDEKSNRAPVEPPG